MRSNRAVCALLGSYFPNQTAVSNLAECIGGGGSGGEEMRAGAGVWERRLHNVLFCGRAVPARQASTKTRAGKKEKTDVDIN